MAQYYAEIQGRRGEATRLGDKKSGMYGHIRGWNIGGQVNMDWDETKGDAAIITVTSGSNGRARAGFTARRGGEDSAIEITHVDHELLEMMTDEALERAIRNSGVLTERLRKLVFLNMDKLA